MQENQICNKISKENLTFIEVIFAFISFTLTFLYMETKFIVEFSSIIGLFLYFMIYVELVRALFDFVLSETHKFKVRYIYDMGIIYIIREILVTITANHHHIVEEIPFIGISLVLLAVLFIMRVVDAKVFNYNNQCNACTHEFVQK